MSNLLDNMELLGPYIGVLKEVYAEEPYCLGCDYKVPLFGGTGLCADCHTPGLALNTYRRAIGKVLINEKIVAEKMTPSLKVVKK